MTPLLPILTACGSASDGPPEPCVVGPPTAEQALVVGTDATSRTFVALGEGAWTPPADGEGEATFVLDRAPPVRVAWASGRCRVLASVDGPHTVRGRVLDELASVDAVTGCGAATVVDDGLFELRTEESCSTVTAWDVLPERRLRNAEGGGGDEVVIALDVWRVGSIHREGVVLTSHTPGVEPGDQLLTVEGAPLGEWRGAPTDGELEVRLSRGGEERVLHVAGVPMASTAWGPR